MYNNDEILMKLFIGEKNFESEDRQVMLETQELGIIYLPTGKIIACDPCCFFEFEPFNKRVDPGTYPVSVYVANYEGEDKRVAFSVITFDDQQPDKFELCLLEGQNLGELKEEEFYGYGVDSGTGGFLDEETWKLIEGMGNDYQYEWLDDELSSSYVYTYSVANIKLPGKEHNIVAFSSGWGDGAYPSYWGIRNGKICCLITDFLIITK